MKDGKRAADRLEPRRPARLRQRAARAGRRQRHREGADRAGRADALSHAAGRVDRRQAVHLCVDARQRRSVQQPVRAADRGRRAVQADVLRSTTPFIRAGRRTASGSPTSPTAAERAAAAGAARDLRRRSANVDDHVATLEASDRRAERAGHRRARRARQPASRVHLVGVGRQVLCAARRLRARLAAPAIACSTRPGPFRLEVPAGKATLDVVKGFEFVPAKVAGQRRRRRGDDAQRAARAADRHVGRRVVQRLDARAHELRRQPAQHAREPDDDVGGRGSGRRQRAGRQQGQPHPRLSVLRARRRRASDLDARTASWSSGRSTGRRSTVTCSCSS